MIGSFTIVIVVFFKKFSFYGRKVIGFSISGAISSLIAHISGPQYMAMITNKLHTI